jgi:FKBP-type peptidyl-prolyl cis-trans isomerase
LSDPDKKPRLSSQKIRKSGSLRNEIFSERGDLSMYKSRKGKYTFFIFSFLLMVILLLPKIARSQTETEPNNSREEANELHLGESIEGLFQNEYDSDWFKLVISESGKNIIRIDLTGVPGVETYFEIYDEEGEYLKRADRAYSGEPEEMANFGVTEGVYYIKVYGSEKNETDKYRLSTQLIGSWQEGQEFEPNDERDYANELRLGESIEGLFQNPSDYDWYKLVISESGKNIIRLDLSGVPGVETFFGIYDENGERLSIADSVYGGEPEKIVNFGVTEGVYYINVSGSEKNDSDTYRFSTQLIGPWQEGQEFEPNDDLEHANELEFEQVIEGYANPHQDIDWFTITVPEPGPAIWTVELSAVPQVDFHIDLFDADGNRLKQANIAEVGENEMLVRMKVFPGRYYITVNSAGGNTDTPYTLKSAEYAKPPATPDEINESLTRALDYLALKQTGEGYWPGMYEGNAGIAGLALMAFVGADCVPKKYSSNITKAINFLKSKYTSSTDYEPGSKDAAYYGGLIHTGNPMYEQGIATLALIEAMVELNDPSLEPIIEDALQLIIRAQNTEHKPEILGGPVNADSPHYGGWRYDPDSIDSDISVTGWQILALKAGLMAGLTIPEWSLQKAADFLRACYDKDEQAFTYTVGSRETGCVRAGIGALGLQLCGYADDPLIPPTLRYMQDNPPVWEYEDPGAGFPFYYWYYATRAMLTAGGDDWQIWKRWMCRMLVDHQNEDGSWEGALEETGMTFYTTAIGALMLELCCGHLPIYMRERVPRPGQVEVMFEQGAEKQAATNVELILDASNSMWGQIQGEAKISIAKNVLEQIINGLPDEMNVGLRLYGHRYGLNDRRACQDTELNVPMGPIDKASLIDIIQKIQPKGKTPLVYSVLQAGNDFQNIQTGSIILITDGVESCDGDIDSIAPALKKLGIDLKVHIVGFDIKEAEARTELEAIAKSTEGTYLDAKDSQELLSSLEQTLQIEFEILDDKGQVRAKGLVGGEAIRIMEGAYTLRLLVDPEPFETAITVKPSQKSTLVLTKQKEKWTIKE